MLKHTKLTIQRLEKANRDLLPKLLHPQRVPVELAAYNVPGEPVPAEEALKARYVPYPHDAKWGPWWGTTWFRLRGEIPAEWAGKTVTARFRLTPAGGLGHVGFIAEGLVYRDGEAHAAVNPMREHILLAEEAKGGESVELFIEAAANGHGGGQTVEVDPFGTPNFAVTIAELAVFDAEAWHLSIDYDVVLDAIKTLDEKSPRRGQLLYAANQVVNLLETRGAEAIAQAREILSKLIHVPNGGSAHEISAVGHAHIDTAWLWPLREGMRKCARTFATATHYMKMYPEYVFVCSQAVQYDWMRARYPKIYEEMKAAAKRGQWEPVGGQWVEADSNVPSGESLTRQFLLGKGYFQREFGIDITNLWLPDVFGYSAALPQIMKLCGIDSFLTQKISWSQFNRFPHHTFLWEGIDGSQVFTHFPPNDNYNSVMMPEQLKKSERDFLEHDRANRSIYVYGYGDGGGGPTREMLERAARLRDFDGLPKVTLERAETFFEKAKADAKDLPVWVGELYLELHRGTFTTQAKTKRGNRKGECVLHDAELCDALDWLLTGAQGESITPQAPARAAYDVFETVDAEARRGRRGALDRAWKLLLLNQFHDILPGSSITWVYKDAEKDYASIQELGQQAREDALRTLAPQIDTGEAEQPLLVVNTQGHPRAEVINTPDGQPLYVEVPPLGYAVEDLAQTGQLPSSAAPVTVSREGDSIVLENGLLRLTLDADGLLSSVHDLACDREVLAPGCRGNLLQLHVDRPHDWDAWEIDLYYRETVEDITTLTRMEVLESGPLRAVVVIERSFGESHFTQQLILRAESHRVDFATTVNWQERKRLLKVAFPVDILARTATYEIQYGHIERPTHGNTSWDMAKFEVAAQHWADLSEGDYGVALLNDCKYGYDVWGNTLRLSLLRGPEDPDKFADLGTHTFTYSLLPHEGDIRQGAVIEEGLNLNYPLLGQPLPKQSGELPSELAWMEIDRPGVVISAVKVSEDGEALIVRLYEAWGTRGSCALALHLPVTAVHEADSLENPGQQLDFENGIVGFELRPFEIKTLRFTRG